MADRWERWEPGWYWLFSKRRTLATVCKEADGRWHTYVKRSAPPGDSTHRTLKAAQRAAERLSRHG